MTTTAETVWKERLSAMDTSIEAIQLPGKSEERLAQDEEWCVVTVEGSQRRIRFHDYAAIFDIPGLYERLFYDRLECISPFRVTRLLADVMREQGQSPDDLRVLDFGAGNGMVGDELQSLGVDTIVGVDIIPEARSATMRDRKAIYQEYLITDMTDLPTGRGPAAGVQRAQLPDHGRDAGLWRHSTEGILDSTFLDLNAGLARLQYQRRLLAGTGRRWFCPHGPRAQPPRGDSHRGVSTVPAPSRDRRTPPLLRGHDREQAEGSSISYDPRRRPTASAVIAFRDISKTFDEGRSFAVEKLSLEVSDGETLVLLGSSGSGKTTLLKMVNGLVRPTSGTVHVDREDTAQVDPVALRRSLGYVFQGIGLFPHMTVLQNVGVVPRLQGASASEQRRRAHEMLELVSLDPSAYGERFPEELSGGQQQRVGVARAIAADPVHLLMDEPFGALDAVTRDELQRELVSLKKRLRKTILFVTHDVFEAVRLGDRIAILHEGRLEQVGAPSDVLRRPATPYVEQLVGRIREQLRVISDVFK